MSLHYHHCTHEPTCKITATGCDCGVTRQELLDAHASFQADVYTYDFRNGREYWYQCGTCKHNATAWDVSDMLACPACNAHICPSCARAARIRKDDPVATCACEDSVSTTQQCALCNGRYCAACAFNKPPSMTTKFYDAYCSPCPVCNARYAVKPEELWMCNCSAADKTMPFQCPSCAVQYCEHCNPEHVCWFCE